MQDWLDWRKKPGRSRTSTLVYQSHSPTAEPHRACRLSDCLLYPDQLILQVDWSSPAHYLANYLCQHSPVTITLQKNQSINQSINKNILHLRFLLSCNVPLAKTNTNVIVQTPHQHQPVGVKVQDVLHEEAHRLCLSCESILFSLWRYFSALLWLRKRLQGD